MNSMHIQSFIVLYGNMCSICILRGGYRISDKGGLLMNNKTSGGGGGVLCCPRAGETQAFWTKEGVVHPKKKTLKLRAKKRNLDKRGITTPKHPPPPPPPPLYPPLILINCWCNIHVHILIIIPTPRMKRRHWKKNKWCTWQK